MLQSLPVVEVQATTDISVSTAHAAKILGASVRTMERMRAQKTGPRAHRVGRVFRYSLAELQRYRESVSDGPKVAA